MNDQMRRYLDDEWDEQPEPAERDRSDKRPTKPLTQERRQQAKEWGRAHAKYHRQLKKAGLKHEKP